VLDLAILGLLREQPRHGYELRRQLSDLGFWSVSFGSLYPALRRLEKQSLIVTKDQSGRRKSYRITMSGQEHLQELLEDDTAVKDDDRSFSLRLAFFRYLEPDARIGVLERRRDHLSERLKASKASIKARASRTKEKMDRYTLALMEHGVRSAEADIVWLDELIESELATEPKRREPRKKKATQSAKGLTNEGA
jgi:DNA-binding PadR family transcriptional regulator